MLREFFLIVLNLLAHASFQFANGGTYSKITVTAPADIAGTYGCAPAMFGSTNAKVGSEVSTVSIPGSLSLKDDMNNNYGDGCSVLSNRRMVSPFEVPLTSRTVLLALKLVNDRYKCSSVSQVANAIEAGASGVLFTNIFEGTIPRTVGYAFAGRPVNIPVCTITREAGEIFRQAGGPIEIDWSGYVGWSSISEPVPPHRETPIEILSPWELKWTYPAAMASFTPDEVNPVSAEVILPKWNSICDRYYFSGSGCERCHNLESPFETPDSDLQGKIFLFTSFPACFESYVYYAYLTQKHGGVAVIMKNPQGTDRLPRSIGPYTTAVQLNIGLYVMKSSHVGHIQYVVSGRNTVSSLVSVHVSLPRVSNGWGPNFRPHEDDQNSLPDTTLTFVSHASGSQALTCSGGSYPAGQATYNPDSMAEQSAALVSAVVDDSCKVQTTPDGVRQGQDCAVCLAKVVDGTVFSNANGFIGKAIILKADDIYCAHEFIDLTKIIQDKGGQSMILVMRDNTTMTLVAGSGISQSLRDAITIPTYNLQQGHGEEILKKLAMCGGASGLIDAVLPELKSGAASARADHAISTALGVTQVVINTKNSQHIVDAGQALFNPQETNKFTAILRKIYLANSCNSQISCHSCYLLDTPILNRASLSNAVAVIELSGATCVRPVYNYVLFAQKLQAKGVLFVTSGNFTLTLGPIASSADSIVIPSFSVSKTEFENAGGSALYYNQGTATFPAVQNYVAPESTVQSSSEMIVNKESAVPDDDSGTFLGTDKTSSIGTPAIVGIAVASIIVFCIVGKRILLIQRRNKMVSFGGMTHEITTQTSDFSNIFDEDRNMFDNILDTPKLLNPSRKSKSGRMSRIQMKSISYPAPPSDTPPSVREDKMKSFDVESAMRHSIKANGAQSKVENVKNSSHRRHTIATSVPNFTAANMNADDSIREAEEFSDTNIKKRDAGV